MGTKEKHERFPLIVQGNFVEMYWKCSLTDEASLLDLVSFCFASENVPLQSACAHRVTNICTNQ